MPYQLFIQYSVHIHEEGQSQHILDHYGSNDGPTTIDLRPADVHLTSDVLVKYCEKLLSLCISMSRRHGPYLQRGGHAIVPAQWVMIKNYTAGPLEGEMEKALSFP